MANQRSVRISSSQASPPAARSLNLSPLCVLRSMCSAQRKRLKRICLTINCIEPIDLASCVFMQPRADRNLSHLPANVSFKAAAALGCRTTTACAKCWAACPCRILQTLISMRGRTATVCCRQSAGTTRTAASGRNHGSHGVWRRWFVGTARRVTVVFKVECDTNLVGYYGWCRHRGHRYCS
eukprot:SAG31_NODE_393_length_16293_cov_15.804372_9_plen_182_part_00